MAPRDGQATAALIVGILSIVASVTCLGLLLGPSAIYMGSKANQRIAASNGARGGKGFARAGLILGIVGTLAGIAWFISFYSAVASLMSLI